MSLKLRESVTEHYQSVCAQQAYELSLQRKEISRLYKALFRIVRQNIQGHPIGHDAIVAARSAVRRSNPEAYAKLTNGGRK